MGRSKLPVWSGPGFQIIGSRRSHNSLAWDRMFPFFLRTTETARTGPRQRRQIRSLSRYLRGVKGGWCCRFRGKGGLADVRRISAPAVAAFFVPIGCPAWHGSCSARSIFCADRLARRLLPPSHFPCRRPSIPAGEFTRGKTPPLRSVPLLNQEFSASRVG